VFVPADPEEKEMIRKVNIIPANYNTQSERTAEIKRAENVFDSTLTGKAAPKP
jgi:hypothetical protein